MTELKIPEPPGGLFSQCANDFILAPTGVSLNLLHSPEEVDALRPLWEWGYKQGIAESEAKAQAAADAELESCCEWLSRSRDMKIRYTQPEELRAARRPKPHSLKQEGMRALNFLFTKESQAWEAVALRRALESIPEDES